jgi:L-seryl-tRNA(Ser) seleniumtransferase
LEIGTLEHDDARNGTSREYLYRMLPAVNDLLMTDGIKKLLTSSSRVAVLNSIRSALERLREEILQDAHAQASLRERIEALPITIANELSRPFPFSLRKVINATGVILHTNLGRAPLSKSALDHVVEVTGGYSNLELDLDSGERGSRDVHVESPILRLIGRLSGIANFAETHRAIIVNNCAAATFLALHALAKGKEVIVTRGELVEIGGGFRIPEILSASGALLREVGTTNCTHLADYENAISAETALILQVHQSNFSMDGFVARASLAELIDLGRRARIPVFKDQGTGLIHALEKQGTHGEATLIDTFTAGCDLVAASGDKLLGGPQCGILIGRKHLVEKIRKDPLFRTYRVDKLTYAALEGTLAGYLSDAPESIPVVRMLQLSPEQIRARCEQIVRQVKATGLSVEVVLVESVIGGGTAPRAKLGSFAVSLKHSTLGANDLLRTLRRASPAIVGRITDDGVLLDLRTVDPESDASLIDVLSDQLLVAPATAEEADR